ncbi:class I SAM-dependent methyltransferase [Streptomyces sp. NPDC047042]|uniref:class I SAM-dependent methyltransferase n=1 Tax=Streptomyces sp. NPDC047042 TaxID=3154807 RepID=UPI0033DD4021
MDGRRRVTEAEYEHLNNLQIRMDTHRRYSEFPDDPDRALFDLLRLPSAAGLLDVGCGTGKFLHALAGQGHSGRLCGIDTSQEAVDTTRSVPGVEAIRAFATKLPFADEEFSIVTARHMLYHVERPEAAVAECRRILASGGTFAALVNHQVTARRTRDLVSAAARALGVPRSEPPINSVHSDSLPPMVEQVFGHAKVKRFDNALVFAEPAPLIAFALAISSFCGVSPEAASDAGFAQEITARVQHWFDANPGPWTDPKGYIICTASHR